MSAAPNDRSVQADDGKHDCPYPECTERLPRSTLACRRHWYTVDPTTRRRVNATWRTGDISAYLAARADAVDEMRSHAEARRV